MKSLSLVLGVSLAFCGSSFSLRADHSEFEDRIKDCSWRDTQCTQKVILDALKKVSPKNASDLDAAKLRLDEKCDRGDAVCATLITYRALNQVLDIEPTTEGPGIWLYCAVTSTGSWLPQRKDGFWIGGPEGWGFDKASGCDEVLAARRSDLICSWNGRSHFIYSISRNKPLARGSTESGGFSTSKECIAALGVMRNGLVCHWSGHGYLPVNVERDSFVTRDENSSFYGYDKINGCQRAIEESSPSHVCSWSGNANIGYIVTEIHTNEVMAKFGNEFERCLKAAQEWKR